MRRVVALLAALPLAACAPALAPAPVPATLRVSAIPDQPPELVQRQHGALVERVCARAGLACRWTPADSYEGLVQALERGEVDLAYLGGVTFVQAAHRQAAVPLAMRDIDFRFTSVVVVRADDPAARLQDLARRSFSFGARSSTSGHYMLRARLAAAGVVPERDFASVAFSGHHDATLRAVALGTVDAGGLNASVFYRRLADGDPLARRLRVLWQSLPYTDYVWAARPGLPAALRERLSDAFLDLGPDDPQDGVALRHESANGYLPAFAEDFDEVRGVLQAQGALGPAPR